MPLALPKPSWSSYECTPCGAAESRPTVPQTLTGQSAPAHAGHPMFRPRVLSLTIALASCGPTAPQKFELVDSLGVAFAIDEEGSWSYSDDPVPLCDAGRDPGWGGIYGRFIYLCSACYYEDDQGYAFDPPADCRVAVCDHDDECPALSEQDYACIAGICQDREQLSSEHVSETSAEALCAAATPRGEPTDPNLEARLAALTCADDRCTLPLPPGCMQPDP